MHMRRHSLSARDFIVRHSDDLRENQQHLISLLSRLSQLALVERQRLGREFLGIITDATEDVIKRSQAAVLLATSSKVFGFQNPKAVVKVVIKIIQDEFLDRGASKRLGTSQRFDNTRLESQRFNFLKSLLMAALLIDYQMALQTAWQSVDSVEVVSDKERLKRLIENAKPMV